VESSGLENLEVQTTPYAALSKNSVDILTEPDVLGWVMEERIEMGGKLFAERLCEYDRAFETAR